MKPVPTRAQLETALADGNPANPLAAAVASALADYAALLNSRVERAGCWPNPLTVPVPDTEIEAFALELFMRELAAAGIRVVVTSQATPGP